VRACKLDQSRMGSKPGWRFFFRPHGHSTRFIHPFTDTMAAHGLIRTFDDTRDWHRGLASRGGQPIARGRLWLFRTPQCFGGCFIKSARDELPRRADGITTRPGVYEGKRGDRHVHFSPPRYRGSVVPVLRSAGSVRGARLGEVRGFHERGGRGVDADDVGSTLQPRRGTSTPQP
jgi:hypothetical protein